MTKQKLEKSLRRELALLNYQIDEKIIRGVSYAKEARRHKAVLESLARIRRVNRSNWLWKQFYTFSLT